MIFNIQKCSIHDGNGLRTLVFFKGCPLRCPWCANPESQLYTPQIMESAIRCIGCGACMDVCPAGAIGEGFLIDREECIGCFECVEHCYAESKRIAGKDYSIDELFGEIEKDRPFYAMYGGGVTFSGGEPLTHAKYLKKIAKKCHEEGINVVVESCGYGNYEEFKHALPYIDGMFMDIKIIDPEKHKQVTGKSNEIILKNIRRICGFGIPVTARTPVVPGYTDDLSNIEGIAALVAKTPGIKEYELLKYHNLGESKYRSLGKEYPLKKVKAPIDEEMNELVRRANRVMSKTDKVCFWTNNNRKEVVR